MKMLELSQGPLPHCNLIICHCSYRHSFTCAAIRKGWTCHRLVMALFKRWYFLLLAFNDVNRYVRSKDEKQLNSTSWSTTTWLACWDAWVHRREFKLLLLLLLLPLLWALPGSTSSLMCGPLRLLGLALPPPREAVVGEVEDLCAATPPGPRVVRGNNL